MESHESKSTIVDYTDGNTEVGDFNVGGYLMNLPTLLKRLQRRISKDNIDIRGHGEDIIFLRQTGKRRDMLSQVLAWTQANCEKRLLIDEYGRKYIDWDLKETKLNNLDPPKDNHSVGTILHALSNLEDTIKTTIGGELELRAILDASTTFHKFVLEQLITALKKQCTDEQPTREPENTVSITPAKRKCVTDDEDDDGHVKHEPSPVRVKYEPIDSSAQAVGKPREDEGAI